MLPHFVPGRSASVGPLTLAICGVAATVGLWILLASITGLIFHLLPGATFLAATWIFRQVEPERRAGWPDVAVIVVAGAVGTALGAAAIEGIGRELDAMPITWLVAAGGALIAMAWLRRTAATDERAM